MLRNNLTTTQNTLAATWKPPIDDPELHSNHPTWLLNTIVTAKRCVEHSNRLEMRFMHSEHLTKHQTAYFC